ncbi:unknown [Prevotella sp. CAG:1124]|nr:unknown [Prevotella sp. CAG:1124]
MVNYVTPFMRRTVCAILLSLLLSVPVTAARVPRFFNTGREAGTAFSTSGAKPGWATLKL